VDIRATLVTIGQASVLMEPTKHALHDAGAHFQAANPFAAAPGNDRKVSQPA
jgi:hypothetical protein